MENVTLKAERQEEGHPTKQAPLGRKLRTILSKELSGKQPTRHKDYKSPHYHNYPPQNHNSHLKNPWLYIHSPSQENTNL